MKTSSFASLIQRFFSEHLPVQRNLSAHTTRSYRQTFRLMLLFLAERQQRSVDRLELSDFTAEPLLAFLDHLERDRKNTIRSRNARLAALRSFARFVLGESVPDFVAAAQRILVIPSKRCVKPVLGFMTRPEITAVLAAINTGSWSGRRDHLFFSVLYNTGARVSELMQLKVADIEHAAVHLRGKGRKNRTVPIWRQNVRRLHLWCRNHKLSADKLVFVNRQGAPLTREGIAFRLKIAVTKAAQNCSSLQERAITPHTFRHTAAMHLLQSGTPLEIIALWMGHSSPMTTHGYVEADLEIKQDCMHRLEKPFTPSRQPRAPAFSHLLAFLETR